MPEWRIPIRTNAETLAQEVPLIPGYLTRRRMGPLGNTGYVLKLEVPVSG
jgi:hypothetical protein